MIRILPSIWRGAATMTEPNHSETRIQSPSAVAATNGSITTAPVHAEETRFERKDIVIAPLLYIVAGLVVVVVISCLVSWWCFDFLQARDRETKISPFPLAAAERNQLPAEPRLEQVDRMTAAEHNQQLPRLYDTELRRLDSYGWVDQTKGIAHIPIEQAMKTIVEQELLKSRPAAKKDDKSSGGNREDTLHDLGWPDAVVVGVTNPRGRVVADRTAGGPFRAALERTGAARRDLSRRGQSDSATR